MRPTKRRIIHWIVPSLIAIATVFLDPQTQRTFHSWYQTLSSGHYNPLLTFFARTVGLPSSVSHSMWIHNRILDDGQSELGYHGTMLMIGEK